MWCACELVHPVRYDIVSLTSIHPQPPPSLVSYQCVSFVCVRPNQSAGAFVVSRSADESISNPNHSPPICISLMSIFLSSLLSLPLLFHHRHMRRQRFCRCTRSGLKQITCPSGLSFDVDKQTCDWKAKVTNCNKKESKFSSCHIQATAIPILQTCKYFELQLNTDQQLHVYGTNTFTAYSYGVCGQSECSCHKNAQFVLRKLNSNRFI